MAVTSQPTINLTSEDVVPSVDRPIAVTRRRIDTLLVALGAVVAVMLVVAGALLQWGSDFSEGYVTDELAAQNISFPDEASLVEQGRSDLARFGGQQVLTGEQAEAYASFIGGHVEGIAGGMTYAELGGPERAAKAAVTEAITSGAPADEVAALEGEAAELTAQRDSIFRGEMLRGALLSTYAWSTIGRIAGIASTVAFLGGAVMALLCVAGIVHLKRAH